MSRGLVVLPAERNILANVPDDQQVVLHHEDELVFNKLAELMDFRNGQIGFSSEVSTHKVASELTETMARKAVRNRSSVDRRAVQRSIDRLVRVGLMERHSENKKLRLIRVYWRDFTLVCKSVQNPDGTADSTKINISFKILSFVIRDLHQFKKVIHSSDGTADGTHNKPLLIIDSSKKKFCLSLDFEFNTEIVKQILGKAGFDYSKIDRRWTSSFISHWWSEGKELNSNQWHDKYAQKMVQYLNNPALFDSLNGGALQPKRKLASVKPLIPPVPRDSDLLWDYAKEHGFPDPGSKTYDQYRKLLISERMRRMDRKEKTEGLK